RRHVRVHKHRDGEAAERRAPQLLREQRRRPRVQPRAAELLRIPQAQVPEPSHLLQHLSRHETLLFPCPAPRDDLLLDVAANALAQQAESIVVVFLGAHDGLWYLIRQEAPWRIALIPASIPKASAFPSSSDRGPAPQVTGSIHHLSPIARSRSISSVRSDGDICAISLSIFFITN